MVLKVLFLRRLMFPYFSFPESTAGTGDQCLQGASLFGDSWAHPASSLARVPCGVTKSLAFVRYTRSLFIAKCTTFSFSTSYVPEEEKRQLRSFLNM
jgi:hypothetical protein